MNKARKAMKKKMTKTPIDIVRYETYKPDRIDSYFEYASYSLQLIRDYDISKIKYKGAISILNGEYAGRECAAEVMILPKEGAGSTIVTATDSKEYRKSVKAYDITNDVKSAVQSMMNEICEKLPEVRSARGLDKSFRIVTRDNVRDRMKRPPRVRGTKDIGEHNSHNDMGVESVTEKKPLFILTQDDPVWFEYQICVNDEWVFKEGTPKEIIDTYNMSNNEHIEMFGIDAFNVDKSQTFIKTSDGEYKVRDDAPKWIRDAYSEYAKYKEDKEAYMRNIKTVPVI